MMVQPRTLFIGIFTIAAVLVGAVVFLIIRANSGDGNQKAGQAQLPAVVSEAQIVKTSLFELAQIANLVRAAYDQKIAAADSDAEPEILCGELFKEVDLSLIAHAVTLDIDQKIAEIVQEKRLVESLWSDCEVTCTCGALASLLEQSSEAGESVDARLLEAAQKYADALTATGALQCAEANIDICSRPLVHKYVEQAATIE